jgi:cyclic beta-1,2-glucan synthetase
MDAGFRMRGTKLCIDPCIPRHWPGYSMHFRYHGAVYDIAVENPRRVNRGVMLIELDGKTLTAREDIPLLDDGAEHRIRIVLG